MRVSIVGSGYVGLVSGAGLSDVGHHVVCMDIDEARVESLRQGTTRATNTGVFVLERWHRLTDQQRAEVFTLVDDYARGGKKA